jgi:ankyrin repeat protein
MMLNARNHLAAVPLGDQESFCCKLMTTILNARDQDGNTALHLAVLSGNQESFCLLLRRREVDLNIANRERNTPT